ncbi:CT620/CT621 family type III secretion system effector [Candidatus Chlamydia sanziniae]|uniref:Effector from type III secretion system family protein n=1 Tax=Candidatus Chlamydia sanziniae TaxID=1806891 RepID=A0A1A9HVU6_9CHLA|nr:CT620/CT621 family type III secretion system effector [Candidatus Chlamydia sanziniae]ANH78531.1 hypothetical protein Cs308_0360 [Candidatus Chlamydia sanziniae]
MIYNNSISACYKKPLVIIPEQLSIQKPTQLLEQIFHYEKTTTERYMIQQLLDILEQKTNEQARLVKEKLEKYQIERGTITKSIPMVAQHEKPLSSSLSPIAVSATTSATPGGAATSSTYYNSTKQNWAKNLITEIKKVMDTIITQVNSLNPTNKSVFLQLQTELNQLVTADTNLTDENFVFLYSFPSQISTAIQRANTFTGKEKTEFTNQLAEKYGTEGALVQIFADSRVEGFQDILDAVQAKLTEEQFQMFLKLKTELQSLADQTSEFNTNELQHIGDVGETFAQLIRKSELPRNDKLNFCADLSNLYKDQVAALGSFDTVLKAGIYVNQHQADMFSELSNFVTSLMGVFAPIDLSSAIGEISSAAVAGALQTLRGINARFSEFTVQQQKLINDAVTLLKGFNGEKYCAAVWTYFIASTVLANNPSATMTDVTTAIRAEIRELENSKFGLAATMKSAMENIISSNGTFTVGKETYTIYSQKDSKVQINQVLLNAGSVGFLPQVSKVAREQADNTARAYFRFKALATVESETLESSIATLQTKLKQFTNMKNTLFVQQLIAQASEVRAMTLPSAVASVLIDRYMPKEVDYLNQIYGQLYYSNLGSSVGNAIIAAIAYYVNGATYFNFASYVGQQPAVGVGGTNAFPGSQESAQAKLNREREQITVYLQATQKALVVLEEQKQKVLADDRITSEQRTHILDALRNYKDNVNSISGSLVLLQNYLKPLSITKGSVAGTFIVNGGQEQWQGRLQILEDALVSGLVGAAVNGGMFPLQATVQSDQQSFADMGQNFQLELQMHLTSMQQEWTVVATSLQVLNQMYLSLARSLTG